MEIEKQQILIRKFDLTASLIPGVTYRNVRDGLKTIRRDNFTIDYLCGYIYAPIFQKLIRENIDSTPNTYR